MPVAESLNHNMHGCFIRTGSAGRPIFTVAAHGITWKKITWGAQRYFFLYTFSASCGRWATPLKSTVLHLGRPGLGDSTNKDVNVNREKRSWRKRLVVFGFAKIWAVTMICQIKSKWFIASSYFLMKTKHSALKMCCMTLNEKKEMIN